MKKIIMSFFMLIFAFLFVSCGGSPSSDNGGGGTHVEVVNFSYEYNDETGVFSFSNYEKGELVLLIDGIYYSVEEDTFDVKMVIQDDGEYGVYLYYYQNGRIQQKDYFIYNKLERENGYIVAFFDDNGQTIKRISVDSGYVLTLKDYPTYENITGMTFSWDNMSYIDRAIDCDININLIVEYEIYTITYNLNGGQFESDPITSYTVKDEMISLTTPFKDGYNFAGWFSDESFTGESITSIDILNPKNIEVYAKWIELSATAKDLLSVINDSINQVKQTYSIKVDGKKSELALDFSSSNIYVHSMERNDVYFVIEDNKYYDFTNNTYVAKNYSKEEYFDPLGLKDMVSQFKSVSVSTKLGKVVYEAELMHSGYKMTFTLENDLLSKVKMTAGKDSEEYSITYTCDKVSFDKSKFKEKMVVTIYLIEIRDGIIPEQLCYYGEVDVTGQALKDVEIISNLVFSFSSYFGGMYLDKEMSQAIDLSYVPKSSLDIFIVDYGRSEEAAAVYEFDLNVHCQCDQCQSDKSYKNITLADLSNITHFEGYEVGMYKDINLHKIENGKIIMGWFTSNNKESEMFAGFEFAISEHLNQGKYYEKLTIDIYSHIEYVETVTVKEYCDCDLHKNGYYESYYVKGNYYFINESRHKKEGYRCMYFSTSSNSDEKLTDIELQKDTSVYLKWVVDTRVTVNLHSTLYNHKETLTAESYEIYNQIKEQYNGVFNDQYVLEGLYFDAAFTKKITADTPIPDGCDIYLKFDLGSLVVFETITGDSLYVCLPKSFKLDEVNWQAYIKETNLNGFEKQLGELIYRSSSYSEFVTLSEFYADRELTKKVNEIGNLTHIYLGYKQQPIVNVICVDDCRHNHEPLINNQTGMLYKHEHYDDATSKQGYIEFYLDEECSIVFNHEMYNYATEDYSIYGKFVEKSVLYTIHCGCLNHPNGISNTFNSFYEATLECDYGYSHTGFAMEGFRYYRNSECSEEYWESPFDKEVELWVKTLGTVTIYCDCPLHKNLDNYQIVVSNENEYHFALKTYLLDLHHFSLNGATFEMYAYINNDRNNALEFDNTVLKHNDRVYCEVIVDENYIPLNVYFDDQVQSSYYDKHMPIYLPTSYNNYKVTGYYLDKDFNVEANTNKEQYQYTIYYYEGLVNLYAKLELAPMATFTFLSYEKEEITRELYIFSEYDTVLTLYYMMRGKAGYLAYIVDENNNRCYPTDQLQPINYHVYYEKTNEYVQVSINCDCMEPCYKDRYAHYMEDDGTIRVVYEENVIYVLKNTSCMREVYEGYGFHCNEYVCYDLYSANIYVNGVKVEDKSIFDYMYGMEMPPHLKDPFIFTEDANIEISFEG